MKLKIKQILLLLFIFSFSLVSSSQFGYNYLDSGTKVQTGANYSINVNNTNYLQGLTPQQVANLYVETNWNSTGLIINWTGLIYTAVGTIDLQAVLTAGNTSNHSFALLNTETDPYCQGTPNDPTCYNNYFDQPSCEAYDYHNNQCFWYPTGSCDGDTFSYCYYQYYDEMSCNSDPICGYWDGASCYPTMDCSYDGYDETSCNSMYPACSWTDYSYCENQAELTCSQTATPLQNSCEDVAGCSWETDVAYQTIGAGRFISNITTGVSPLEVASTTKVDNLNADYLDGQDSTYFSATGACSAGYVVTATTSSGVTCTSAKVITGSMSAPAVTQLGGYQPFAVFNGETSIISARQSANGGATFGHSDINGVHWMYSKLDNSYIGGFGITSSGYGSVGILSSAGANLATWYFNPAGIISTTSPVSLGAGASTTTMTSVTDITNFLIAKFINSTIVGNYDVLGTEKLTNPNFDSGSGSWDLTGYTYSSGRLQTTTSGTVIQNISAMASAPEVNKVYLVDFTLTVYSGGGCSTTVSFCGQDIGTYTSSHLSTQLEAVACTNASAPLTFTTTDTTSNLIRLDSITIKEVGSADLNVLGTTLTKDLKVLNQTDLKNTSIIGNLNQTNGNAFINNIYGAFYYENDTGYTLDLITPEVYANTTNWSQGISNGMTMANNKSFQVNYNGIYDCFFKITYSDGANGEHGGGIFVNDVKKNNCYDYGFTGTSNAKVHLSNRCNLNLTTSDIITVVMDDHASPVTDPIIYIQTLNCMRIGN